MLQQLLPFTVLKLVLISISLASGDDSLVATALTVYGIETGGVWDERWSIGQLQQLLPFTVLKPPPSILADSATDVLQQLLPFTVLKQYDQLELQMIAAGRLQQLLPFTVLKRLSLYFLSNATKMLQQLLPFTVLKHLL